MDGSEARDGRWCGACGGELLYRRRRVAAGIATYLICQFCGERRLVLLYDAATNRHRDLLSGKEEE